MRVSFRHSDELTLPLPLLRKPPLFPENLSLRRLLTPPGLSWGAFGRSWAPPGRSWAVFWGSCGILGRLGQVFGKSLAGLGRVLGASWRVWRRSWAVLGRLGAVLGRSLGSLGASWPPRPTKSEGDPSFEALLAPSWARFWKVFRCLFGQCFIMFLSYLETRNFKMELAGYVWLTFRPSTSKPFQVFQRLVRPFKSGQVLKAFPDGQARPCEPDRRPRWFGPP